MRSKMYPKGRLISTSNSNLAQLLLYLFVLSISLPLSNAFAPPTILLQLSLSSNRFGVGISELQAAELLPDFGVAPSNNILVAMSDEDTSLLATALGYLIGAGSLLLYTASSDKRQQMALHYRLGGSSWGVTCALTSFISQRAIQFPHMWRR